MKFVPPNKLILCLHLLLSLIGQCVIPPFTICPLPLKSEELSILGLENFARSFSNLVIDIRWISKEPGTLSTAELRIGRLDSNGTDNRRFSSKQLQPVVS